MVSTPHAIGRPFLFAEIYRRERGTVRRPKVSMNHSDSSGCLPTNYSRNLIAPSS